MNPSHTYTEAGKYLVTLTVTDDQGLVSEVDQMDITVRKSRGKK